MRQRQLLQTGETGPLKTIYTDHFLNYNHKTPQIVAFLNWRTNRNNISNQMKFGYAILYLYVCILW